MDFVHIKATKKGKVPISYSKTKYNKQVTTITQIVANGGRKGAKQSGEEGLARVEDLCSRIAKALGTGCRTVEEKGEVVIEIQGKHGANLEQFLLSEDLSGCRVIGFVKTTKRGDDDGTVVVVVDDDDDNEWKKERKPRHVEKKYFDNKGEIKDSLRKRIDGSEDDVVRDEDVQRVKKLRETDKEFARFAKLMSTFPFWSHRYDKLAEMYFEKKKNLNWNNNNDNNNSNNNSDSLLNKKRRRCEIAFEEDEEYDNDEDGKGAKIAATTTTLEELGMVSDRIVGMSRDERARAARLSRKLESERLKMESDMENNRNLNEEKEDIASKMLRMRGFLPAQQRKSTVMTVESSTTTIVEQKKNKAAVVARTGLGRQRSAIESGTTFNRKQANTWSQKQFIKEEGNEEDENEEDEDRANAHFGREEFPSIRTQKRKDEQPNENNLFGGGGGGYFLMKNKTKEKDSLFPPLVDREHCLPHEEFQRQVMSEEDALKMALSKSLDAFEEEKQKRDELSELEHLEIARAVSMSEQLLNEEEKEKQEEKQVRLTVSDSTESIALMLRKIGFDSEVSETLANEVIPAMPTYQDIIDLLGTLGVNNGIASNIANFIVAVQDERRTTTITTTRNVTCDDPSSKDEQNGLINTFLYELTGSLENGELLGYLRAFDSPEEAGSFLRESFAGSAETYSLGVLIWNGLCAS